MHKLNVFDFDNTLYNTPENSPENHAIYEKATGIPWNISKKLANELSKKLNKRIFPRTGWYGKAETLMPPLVPSPAPKEKMLPPAQILLDKKKIDNEITIILTGRHTGLEQQVLRILHEIELLKIDFYNGKYLNKDKVQVFLNGHDGPIHNYEKKMDSPKPHKTFPWKTWIISQFILMYRDLNEVEIWDDRQEHVLAFDEFAKEFNCIKFKINHVKH